MFLLFFLTQYKIKSVSAAEFAFLYNDTYSSQNFKNDYLSWSKVGAASNSFLNSDRKSVYLRDSDNYYFSSLTLTSVPLIENDVYLSCSSGSMNLAGGIRSFLNESNGGLTNNRNSLFRNLQSGTSCGIRTLKGYFSYSDGLSKGTSWAVFRYISDNLFYGLLSGIIDDNLVFEDIKEIKGIGYALGNIRIVKSGIYFLSVSIETTSEEFTELEIYLNGKPIADGVGKIVMPGGSSNVTISRSWIFQFNEKDDLIIRTTTELTYPNPYTSLLILRLGASPSSPAFSAVNTIGWNGSGLNSIPLNKVLLNVGNYWDVRNNYYVIYTTGYYFISLTGGKSGSKALDIELKVNDKIQAEIINFNTLSYQEETCTRTLFIRLNETNILKLSSPAESVLDDKFSLTTLTIFYVSRA